MKGVLEKEIVESENKIITMKTPSISLKEACTRCFVCENKKYLKYRLFKI